MTPMDARPRPTDPASWPEPREAMSWEAEVPSVRLRGWKIHALTQAQCVRHILAELDAGRGGWVATVNVDHLRRLGRDHDFGSLYAQASLVVADGMPLVWASRLQGTPLPERVAGSDLICSLSAAAAERGRSVFLLGGTPGTAQAASARLRAEYPALRIAGCCCPQICFEAGDLVVEESARVRRREIPRVVGSAARARALGWTPTIPLRQTLRDLLDYWRVADG